MAINSLVVVFRNIEQMRFQQETRLLKSEMAEIAWQQYMILIGEKKTVNNVDLKKLPLEEDLLTDKYTISQSDRLYFCSTQPPQYLFTVGSPLDSLSSGPQVKEITVIKCHDENRKMSFLLVLQRDLIFNACLHCAHLPRSPPIHPAPTHVHSYTHTHSSVWPISILKKNPSLTWRCMYADAVRHSSKQIHSCRRTHVCT